MKAPDPNSPIYGGYFRNKELAMGTTRMLDAVGVWCEVVPDGIGFCLVSRGRTMGLLMQPIRQKHGSNGNGNGKSKC